MDHEKKKDTRRQFCAFIVVGAITLVYSLTELGAAAAFNSLALLSDGFHNLSDVISLFIAFYALKAKGLDASDQMSYGWARSEILGGLINGSFLLSLSLYIVLEAIPKFIHPDPSLTGNDLIIFISIAAGGVLINTVGTLIFYLTGTHGHSHAGGGGHSHGGHDAHSHELDTKKKKYVEHKHDDHEHGVRAEEVRLLLENDLENNDGHSHEGHSHEGHSHEGHSHEGHSHDGDKKREKAIDEC